MPGVKNWLKKASNDLKAFIVLSQKAIPRTHDLSVLLANCMKINNELVLLHEESRSLDSYGYDSRYPNDSFYVDKQSVEEAIKMAEKIFIMVKKKVNF